MELFFQIFLPSNTAQGLTISRSPLLCAFPIFILVLGWIFSKLCDLLADCFTIQGGGFVRLRLVQLCFLYGVTTGFGKADDYELLGKPFDFSPTLYKIVDFFQPVLFDAILLAMLVYNSTCSELVMEAVVTEAVRLSIWITFVYASVYIVLEIVVFACPKLREMYEEKMKYARRMNRSVKSESLFPIVGLTLFASIFPKSCVKFLSGEGSPSAPIATERTHETRAFLVLWFILYLLSNIIAMYNPIFGFYCMMICLIMLVVSVEHHIESWLQFDFFTGSFKVFVVTFLILSSALFSMALKMGGANDAIKNDFEIVGPQVKELSNPVWTDQLNLYPVCSVNYYGLHILDLNMLAAAAYLVENKTELELALKGDFENTFLSDWELKNITWHNYMAFYEVYFPTTNTTVVAVRGTCTGMDALKDMHYWFGIGFLQILTSYIFPVLHQVPTLFVQKMLLFAGTNWLGESDNYKILTDYVQQRKLEVCGQSIFNETTKSCNFLVTGHSLGGGMAALAGTLGKVPAVSFSGPGLRYNILRFGIATQEDVEHHVTTIKPDGDVVPAVDMLLGTIQFVTCPYKNPLACHMPLVTANSLRHFCGDPRQRDWSKAKANMKKEFGSNTRYL